jgi:acyl-CoA synthetase (AMP-forming)/AMP-acid ligase II
MEDPFELVRRAADALRPDKIAAAVEQQIYTVRVLLGTGFAAPVRPDKIARAVWLLQRWSNTPAGAYSINALTNPERDAVIDELGSLTFRELHLRTNALAHELSNAGIGPDQNVAVMCRNHRYFVEATVALSKLGANTLYLNTAFAGPQIAEVVKREAASAVIYDSEFEGLVAAAKAGRACYTAWESDSNSAQPTLKQLIETGDRGDLDPPPAPGRVVILTSGTTGTPKGAARSQPKNLDPAVALLSRIPLKARERALIAAPLFHSWGFAHFSLGLVLSSTYVLQRHFDPEATLAAVERYRPTVMAVVPVMLQRIMQLPEKVRRKYDTSSLRVVAVSGSALPGELATSFMDEFGDILYNLYGSTEAAWASIATPQDLRAAPGTAGVPPRGTVVRLFDDQNQEVQPGGTGRIFVANEMLFDGYTSGGNKANIEGMLSTGDVGHIDANGRLFVEGRDDEMIVSGGENVFPAEVEDLLARHAGVAEAAVIGIPDKEFGQRLKAFVVRRPGSKLTDEQLKTYVKSNLARYKVPREVEFMDELPRNSTGKVVKRKLAPPAHKGNGAKPAARSSKRASQKTR